MNRSITTRRLLFTLAIPLGLLVILVFLMRSALVWESNNLSLAITVDLLFTVPVVYFLLIRKTSIPNFTVVPLIVLGLIIGTYLLPIDQQSYLTWYRLWVLPVLELSILVLIIIKVRSLIKGYKAQKDSNPDFFTALKTACGDVLPKRMVGLFATEIGVIYYGFLHWQTRTLDQHEFGYHQKSGTPALLGALILVIAVETLALHFLIGIWSNTAAWIFTAIGIYTGIQLFGFARSLSQRPISLEDGNLNLRYGILSEIEIALSNIEAVTLSKKNLEENKLTIKLSPFGQLESHNVLITLKETSELIGLYGFRKKCKEIGLHVDKPENFKDQIMSALAANG